MKKDNLYILFLIQAVLSILLIFGDGTLLYIGAGAFVLVDLAIIVALFSRTWFAGELYAFITVIVSLFYVAMRFYGSERLLWPMAIGVSILFVLSAIVTHRRIPATLPVPARPHRIETYDLDEMERDLDELDRKKKDAEKTKTKALAYELEREAAEIKRAENFIKKKETQLQASKEEHAMEKAASVFERAIKEAELKREKKDLEKAQKDMEEMKFLDRQRELNRQAVELVKAQAKMAKTPSKTPVKRIQTASKKDNPVFATKSGNNFHEPGCMVIKKIPKKNLVLFNNQKEALKKGYKPCNVCKP